MKSSIETRPDTKEPEFSFGNFRLNSDGTLYRGETQIHLPPKELAALRFLLTHAGEVVTPAQLRLALWGDVHVTSDSIPRCLSSVRARLEPEQCIQTIYKRGYRFIGPVRHNGAQQRRTVHLAIMPFAVGHTVPEHLGPAIAEEVTARLTMSSPAWLSILARDSMFTLAQRGMSAVHAGQMVKADLVLAGTLLALPTHYRLRAEMIRVEDGIQVWVEDILAARGEIAELQSELVERLVFRLGGEFSTGLNVSLEDAARPEQGDAYDLFLRGHHEWQTLERYRMRNGMEHLLRATELDPLLLSAQVDLAHACLAQEFYGFLSPELAANQVRRIENFISDAAEQAPALLPALGWVDFHFDRDFGKALEKFSASAHLPHDAWITRLRVMFALSRHRFEEAEEWMNAAIHVDPYSPWLHARLAWTYHLAERPARSIGQIEKSLSLFPDHESSLLFGALILAFNGQADRALKLARQLLHRMPFSDLAMAIHAYALARSGQQEEALSILERLQWLTRERFVLRSFTAAAYVALHDNETAIAELRAAADARCPWFFQTLADPRLESLHGHPEFRKLQGMLQEMELSAGDTLEYQT